jgi:CubicO group peptidase (beta-lactamase class C family)
VSGARRSKNFRNSASFPAQSREAQHRASPHSKHAGRMHDGSSSRNYRLFSTASDYMRFAQMLINRGTLDGRQIERLFLAQETYT